MFSLRMMTQQKKLSSEHTLPMNGFYERNWYVELRKLLMGKVGEQIAELKDSWRK